MLRDARRYSEPAITLAFVGSVISETVAANSGLGFMMSSAQSQFNVPLVFAGLVMLAVEGIVMYALMAWIERRTTGWAHRSTTMAGQSYVLLKVS